MLKIIHVGLGKWGGQWARDIVIPSGIAKLSAVVEKKTNLHSQIRDFLGGRAPPVFGSLKEAIEKVAADAVLITARAETHAELVRTALMGDKHVLVEKPFTLNFSQAKQLVKIAKRKNLVLMVSQNYRHYPAVQKLKDVIERKFYGETGEASVRFQRRSHKEVVLSKGMSLEEIRMERGKRLLYEIGIHHIDLIRYVFNQTPRWVSAVCTLPWGDPQASISASLIFGNHFLVEYHLSLMTSVEEDTPWGGAWRVVCRKGVLHMKTRPDFRAGDESLIVESQKNRKNLPLPVMSKMDRKGVLREFVRGIVRGAPIGSTGEDNLKSLAVLLAMMKSMKSNKREIVRI